jgi:hypothetical protein
LLATEYLFSKDWLSTYNVPGLVGAAGKEKNDIPATAIVELILGRAIILSGLNLAIDRDTQGVGTDRGSQRSGQKNKE